MKTNWRTNDSFREGLVFLDSYWTASRILKSYWTPGQPLNRSGQLLDKIFFDRFGLFYQIWRASGPDGSIWRNDERILCHSMWLW